MKPHAEEILNHVARKRTNKHHKRTVAGLILDGHATVSEVMQRLSLCVEEMEEWLELANKARAARRPAFACALLALFLSGPAHASLPANQCDISSTAPDSACNAMASIGPNGKVVVNDTSAQIVAARSMAHSQALTAINAYGECYFVNNNTGMSLFIPFRTKPEWDAFIAHKPGGIELIACNSVSVAAAVPVAVSAPVQDDAPVDDYHGCEGM